MRAFSFDKEPAFKSMEATSIWGSLISAGASLAGGAMGADAAKDAAKREYAANKQSLELQREQQALAEGYLSPYYDRGQRADASLDALLYGEGYFGGEGSDPRYARSVEDVLRERYPDMAAQWNEWESKDKGKPNGHRAIYGDFVGWIEQTHPELVQRAQSDLRAEQANGGSNGTRVTRDQVFANIESSLPWQFNQQDFNKRQELNRADFNRLEALNEEDYSRAQKFTRDEIAAWVANAQAEQDKSIDALFNRGGLTGQVGATRRGVAQVGEEFARDRAQYAAGRRRADYNPYAQRRVGNYDQFSKRRAGNYDTYAAGRLSAYGGYLDQLEGDSSRGYQAGTGIASGGQTYADNAGRILTNGARAQAGYASDASKAWATGIQGAAGYLSDAYTSGGKKPTASASYSVPESYGDYTSVSDSYHGYDDDGAPTGYVSTRPRRSSGSSSSMYSGLYN